MNNNPIVPNSASKLSKKEQVADMFNDISEKYDFLNHFLSLGIDHLWRKKAVNSFKDIMPQKILDIACGTGDLAITAAQKITGISKIYGIDIAEQMVAVGKKKIVEKGLDGLIELGKGDSEQIEFEDAYFDVVMCAYGVRNFQDLKKGLDEMSRVLRKGGKLAILEFSKPQKFPIKQGYYFYFKFILPLIGKLMSKNKDAYTYLPNSVMAFPEGTAFIKILESSGFKSVKSTLLSQGITTLYTAIKA